MANKDKKTGEGLLVGTAKKIGTITGKIASLTGAAPAGGEEPSGDPPPTPPPPAAKAAQAVARPGKLPKKNKHRLPRREKKARMKAMAGASPTPS